MPSLSRRTENVRQNQTENLCYQYLVTVMQKSLLQKIGDGQWGCHFNKPEFIGFGTGKQEKYGKVWSCVLEKPLNAVSRV